MPVLSLSFHDCNVGLAPTPSYYPYAFITLPGITNFSAGLATTPFHARPFTFLLRLQRWIGTDAFLYPYTFIPLPGITNCSAGLATTPLHARPFTFLFTLLGITICSAGSATTPLHAGPFTFLFTLPGTYDCNVALATTPPYTRTLSLPYQELRIAGLDWQLRLSMPVLSLSFLPYRELTIATLDWQLRLPIPVRFNFPFYLARNYDLQHWTGNYASPCPSFHFPRARHGRFNRATYTRTSLHLLSRTCYFLLCLLLHLARRCNALIHS
jgi:hypothetical protein